MTRADGGQQHQPVHAAGMPRRQPLRDRAAPGQPHHVRPFQLQRVQQVDQAVGVRIAVERPANAASRLAEADHVHGGHGESVLQQRHEGCEGGGIAGKAMDQQQRRPAAGLDDVDALPADLQEAPG
ncbi:MAG TPA: hypothetical protein VF153_05800 [Candidatus Limnocylindria bacterium]